MARVTLILSVITAVIALLGGFRWLVSEWRNWRNTRKRLIILAVGLFLLPSLAGATNYYVRTGGNDACNGLTDSDGASGACAKLTIQAAVNLATTAGDVVTVHAGTYTGAPTFVSAASGAAGNLITIKAATAETVNVSRITITHNYNTVQNFRVTASEGPTTSGIYVSGSNNRLIGNTLLGVCRGDDACYAMTLNGSTNTVSSNTFDGGSNNVTTSFVAAIILEGNTNEVGPSNVFKDFNSVERVFELYGTANHIFNNEGRNFTWTAGGTVHPDIFQTFCTASHDHIIEGNYFHDMDAQIGNLEGPVAGLCSPPDDTVSDWTFRNNIFANINQALFNHSPRINWYNNVFYHCSSTEGYVILNGYQAGSGTFTNNLFVASGINVNDGWYDGTFTADYNLVADTSTGGAKSGFSEAHGINGGNPHFTTVSTDCVATACDFHILAGSAAIDTGTPVSGFAVDKDGAARPAGAAWDMGAYEYGASVASTSSGLMFRAAQSLELLLPVAGILWHLRRGLAALTRAALSAAYRVQVGMRLTVVVLAEPLALKYLAMRRR